MKNLFLPGTNKNVGYVHKDTMHIYKRYIKYLPLSVNPKGFNTFGYLFYNQPIFLQKEKGIEKHVQLSGYNGYIFDLGMKTYDFYFPKFKTADNLDVIEMAYLYKHWNVKKKNG